MFSDKHSFLHFCPKLFLHFQMLTYAYFHIIVLILYFSSQFQFLHFKKYQLFKMQ